MVPQEPAPRWANSGRPVSTDRWTRAVRRQVVPGQGVNDHDCPMSVIKVSGLRKAYSGTPAVDGLDLDITAGEVFALLGPNGAGKSTTVEILEGHRKRDGGQVEVLGQDPGKPSADWRSR